jgi:hypothetical protein
LPVLTVQKRTQLQQELKQLKTEYADISASLRGLQSTQSAGNYSHFPQKNVITHNRTQDFLDNDNKKHLYIREMQSDLHQAGKAQGYHTEAEPLTKIPENLELRKTENGWGLFNKKDVEGNNLIQASDFSSKEDATKDILRDLNEKLRLQFPYKNTWHELNLKQNLIRAAKENYDNISWPTAVTQTEEFGNRVKGLFNYVYDQAAPQFMSKFGKKFGVKPRKATLNLRGREQEIWTMDLTPEMREYILKEGFPLYAVSPGVPMGVGGAGMAGALSASKPEKEEPKPKKVARKRQD